MQIFFLMQPLMAICSHKGMSPFPLTTFAGTTSSHANAQPTQTTLPLEKRNRIIVFVLMSLRHLTSYFLQWRPTLVILCASGEAYRCHRDMGGGAGGKKVAKCSIIHHHSSTCTFFFFKFKKHCLYDCK